MKEIRDFELCNSTYGKSDGYIKCYRSYLYSKERNLPLITFTDVIWGGEIPEIIETLKYIGESKFVIARGFYGLIDILSIFKECRCYVSSLTTLIYEKSGEIVNLNGIEMTIKN